MARMLGSLILLALLALLSCSGCASWHHPKRVETTSTSTGGPSIPLSLDSDTVGGALQDVSNAALNNWNFRSNRW
jgi:hypothetical protein